MSLINKDLSTNISPPKSSSKFPPRTKVQILLLEWWLCEDSSLLDFLLDSKSIISFSSYLENIFCVEFLFFFWLDLIISSDSILDLFFSFSFSESE